MNPDQVQRLVTEVISRLAPRLGADGRRGTLMAVFTGAGIGFNHCAPQLRGLILDGFSIKMAFSPAAENLIKSALIKKLDGFPHVGEVSANKWLAELDKSRGVVVPMLSVNTLSKITGLQADTLPSNLILQGLFMGLPVIAARDGVDPKGQGRTRAGLNRGTPALMKALEDRLSTFTAYGGHLTGCRDLRYKTNQVLGKETGGAVLSRPTESSSRPTRVAAPVINMNKPLLTGSDIGKIQTRGTILQIPLSTVVTPLARDQITRKGIKLVQKNLKV